MKPRIVVKDQCRGCLEAVDRCKCKRGKKLPHSLFGMKVPDGDGKRGKILTLEEQERLQK